MEKNDITLEELESILEKEFLAKIKRLKKNYTEEEIQKNMPLLRKVNKVDPSYYLNAREALKNRYFVLTELIRMREYGESYYFTVLESIFNNALVGVYPTINDLLERKEWDIKGFKTSDGRNSPLAAIINQCHSRSAYTLIFHNKSWFAPSDSDAVIKDEVRSYFEKENKYIENENIRKNING